MTDVLTPHFRPYRQLLRFFRTTLRRPDGQAPQRLAYTKQSLVNQGSFVPIFVAWKKMIESFTKVEKCGNKNRVETELSKVNNKR